MRLDITRKGMIEVRDASGRLVSRNTVIEEAIEDLTADAEAHPEIELYRITYPEREVRIVPRAVVVPVPQEILVQGSAVQFVQGAGPQSFDLGAAIAAQIPSGHVVTAITPTQNLAGVTANVSSVTIDYDGTSPIGSIANVDYVVTTQQNSAEVDWQLRTSGAGVVWFHDFRSDAEVDQFRWTSANGGNDPNKVGAGNQHLTRLTTDGITGACLEMARPAGTSDPDINWWRPWFPISGGQNGRGVDDPGANGTIALRDWSPAASKTTLVNASFGYYGAHGADYPLKFDGTEYWLQMRVKVNVAARIQSVSGGKVFYLTTNFQSLTGQEMVAQYTVINAAWNPLGKALPYMMYRSGGSFGPLNDSDYPFDSNNHQPANELGYCSVSTQPANCWWYSGGWDTIMLRVKPGLSGTATTELDVWAANPGGPRLHIWHQDQITLPYDGGTRPKGQNALLINPYMNGLNMVVPTYARFCQVIFSKSEIPWPQV